jgi:hypothetical protein
LAVPGTKPRAAPGLHYKHRPLESDKKKTYLESQDTGYNLGFHKKSEKKNLEIKVYPPTPQNLKLEFADALHFVSVNLLP